MCHLSLRHSTFRHITSCHIVGRDIQAYLVASVYKRNNPKCGLRPPATTVTSTPQSTISPPNPPESLATPCSEASSQNRPHRNASLLIHFTHPAHGCDCKWSKIVQRLLKILTNVAAFRLLEANLKAQISSGA